METNDIDRGRAWIILVAAYLGNFIFTAIYYTSGVIYVELIRYFRDDVIKTSLIGSLNSALLCLLGPVTAFFINRFSSRVTTVFGGLVMSVACFVSAFATSIDWLIITLGICGGIGNSFAGIPVAVVTGYSFNKYRETVLTLGSVMIGIGMFVSSPLMIGILSYYGLHGGFIMLSGISLQMCVIGMLLKPSSLERQLKQRRKYSATKSANDNKENTLTNEYVPCMSGCFQKLDQLFHISILKSIEFDFFLLSTMSWNLMTAICQMHLPNYMSVKGESSSHISLVMTLFGVGNTLGRLFGTVSVSYRQKIDLFYWQVLFLLVPGITACSFPLYKNLASSEIFFTVITGFCTGGTNSLLTPLTLRILGVEHLSAGYGMEFFFSGVGFLMGPPIASALFTSSNTYDTSFIFAGSVSIIGSLSATIALLKLRNVSNVSMNVIKDIDTKSDVTIPLRDITE